MNNEKKKASRKALALPITASIEQPRNLNLDSFRGLMALSVIISHVEYIRFFFNMPSHFVEPLFFHLGRIGVTGFFVLSGFLITNNLLKLKKEERPVAAAFKLFYLKRALRILPPYYLIILLSMFVLPYISCLHYQVPPGITDARAVLPEVAVFYYALLPQIAIAKFIVLPFAEPTWSIGVEEMFYLLVPLFVFFTGFRKRWIIVLSILLVLLKVYIWVYIPGAERLPFFSFLILSRFECIMVGCLMSCLVAGDHKIFRHINAVYCAVACLLLIICVITIHFDLYIYLHFAVFFGVIILYLYKHPVRFLNNKVMVFIGKISFSIYLVHEIAVVFLLNIETISPNNEFSSLTLYVLAIALSILLGWIFYKIVEEPFLKLKARLDQKHALQ
ncbi:MAG: acyltransferase [Chitinophagaceae bacterium]|nr:acyltransferase [Chitinophagaceae bacterium]